MLSRVSQHFKRIYARKIHVFAKAFKTQCFEFINWNIGTSMLIELWFFKLIMKIYLQQVYPSSILHSMLTNYTYQIHLVVNEVALPN